MCYLNILTFNIKCYFKNVVSTVKRNSQKKNIPNIQWKYLVYLHMVLYLSILQLHENLWNYDSLDFRMLNIHTLSLRLTWCNGSWYRSALHIILNSHNTDVVLHSWTEVLQGAGVLSCLHKLLHTVSLLPIGGSACYSVASDVLEGGSWKRERNRCGCTMRKDEVLKKMP